MKSTEISWKNVQFSNFVTNRLGFKNIMLIAQFFMDWVLKILCL